MKNDISIRNQLIKICCEMLDERTNAVIAALETVKEGMQQETKSSMGDKFETTRAHLHMEENKLHQQINELNLLKQRMDVVSRTTYTPKIDLGSVVFTDAAHYYIAIPIGKITVDNRPIFAISPISPIGQLLMHKQKGDVFIFNQKEIKILEVL
jgi:transcription elongation GreA/GreB family factor